MTYPALLFLANGRFSRAQYWIGLGLCAFLNSATDVEYSFLAIVSPQHGFDGLAWLALPLAFAIWFYIAYLLATIHIRRCHDLGMSGWVALAALLTIVGLAPLIVLCGFRSGGSAANRYGRSPLADQADVAEVFEADTS